MEKMRATAKKILFSYRHLPDKKQYVEFFTAILTVPVLITVIILNLNNLKAANTKTTNTTANTSTTVAPQKIYITVPTNTNNTSPNATTSPLEATQPPCKAGIGSVSIDSPQEGDTVNDNPVSITINYTPTGYCAVVWSYRTNGGSWSNYDNKSIALYNLSQGPIRFELRVQSITSGGGEKDLTRNFIYKGLNSNIAPTDKTGSSSAN